MSKTLIKGGCVLTLGPRTANHAQADLLIENGVISEIGRGVRARGAEVIDASDCIVMPGFVDAHRHAWKSLFRNFGDGKLPGDLFEQLSPSDAYAATLISLLGAAESAITTVVDWSDCSVSPGHLEAVRQAHKDAGLRSVLVVRDPATGPEGPTDAGVAYAYAASTPETSEEAAAEIDRGRSLGVRVHMHAGTAPAHDGLVAEIARRGLVDGSLTLIHCTSLGASDFDAISQSGARVVITPTSEMAGGLGIPPLQMLIDRSIRPGLGVDAESLGLGDAFAQMRAANSIQHASLFDLKLAGKGGIPNLLSTRDVIKYATLDGARSVGLEHTTGSLEPGKQADVIVLRADRPNIAPVNDPIGAVVWGMDTSNIDWVFAGGRAVVRDGLLTADVNLARTQAETAVRAVSERAGLLASSATGGPA